MFSAVPGKWKTVNAWQPLSLLLLLFLTGCVNVEGWDIRLEEKERCAGRGLLPLEAMAVEGGDEEGWQGRKKEGQEAGGTWLDVTGFESTWLDLTGFRE